MSAPNVDFEVLIRLAALAAKRDPGPNLHFEIGQLSPTLQNLFHRQIERMVEYDKGQGRNHEYKYFYLATLDQFGLQCPHPIKRWIFGDDFNPAQGIECQICGAWIVRRINGEGNL